MFNRSHLRLGKSAPRCFLFVALILIGGTGCVYVPEKQVLYQSSIVGTSPESAIRVGSARREDIERKWGLGTFHTDNRLAVGYVFGVTKGKFYGVVAGPCMPVFGSQDKVELDDVWMEFDAAGVLRRYERGLVRKFNGDDEKAWDQFRKTVADTYTASLLFRNTHRLPTPQTSCTKPDRLTDKDVVGTLIALPPFQSSREFTDNEWHSNIAALPRFSKAVH